MASWLPFHPGPPADVILRVNNGPWLIWTEKTAHIHIYIYRDYCKNIYVYIFQLLYFEWSPPWHFKQPRWHHPRCASVRWGLLDVVRFYVSLIISSSSSSSLPPPLPLPPRRLLYCDHLRRAYLQIVQWHFAMSSSRPIFPSVHARNHVRRLPVHLWQLLILIPLNRERRQRCCYTIARPNTMLHGHSLWLRNIIRRSPQDMQNKETQQQLRNYTWPAGSFTTRRRKSS